MKRETPRFYRRHELDHTPSSHGSFVPLAIDAPCRMPAAIARRERIGAESVVNFRGGEWFNAGGRGASEHASTFYISAALERHAGHRGAGGEGEALRGQHHDHA
jgi:hypothetical protein